jgi:hypothetical protein
VHTNSQPVSQQQLKLQWIDWKSSKKKHKLQSNNNNHKKELKKKELLNNESDSISI